MPGKRLPYYPQAVRAKTATPELVTESRAVEKLAPGTEVAFGTEVVTVVDCSPEPEGVWVELSTGDMGYCDYGAKYEVVML
jgi:hypothetical protein